MNRVACTRTCAWLARLLWRPPLRLLIILTINVFGTIYSAKTAPVTFRFDATIDMLAEGFPFNTGLEYAVGDTVSGSFSFQPNMGDGDMNFDTTQAFPFVFRINGHILSTQSFESRSTNDAGIEDFPPASVIDSLTLEAGGLAPVDGSIHINPELSAFRMTLFGPPTVLQMASHPLDVADWNALNLWRQLTIDFRDGKGGAIGLHATVGQFVAVPEPATLTVSFFLSVLVLWSHREPASRIRRGWK